MKTRQKILWLVLTFLIVVAAPAGLLWSQTPDPSLCVWFLLADANATPATAVSTQKPLVALLADEQCVMAGRIGFTPYPPVPTSGMIAWMHLLFLAEPRRSPVLECCLFDTRKTNGHYREIGRVRFSNPLFGHFPQWQPAKLPAVEKAGDVTVHLKNFMTGTPINGEVRPMPIGRGYDFGYTPAQTGDKEHSVFDLEFDSPRGTNEIWTVESAELSDATGNHLRDRYMSAMSAPRYSIFGTLWPDEAAWRLKLDLKRTSGQAPDEFVTFKNVPVPPVGATNTITLTKFIGGFPIVLRHQFVRMSGTNSATGKEYIENDIRLAAVGQPSGVAVDYIGFITDTGEKPKISGDAYGIEPGDHARVVYLRSIPAGVKTMDFTWVVQKTRSVEFLVKPRKVGSASE